jgi:hypothetical protein
MYFSVATKIKKEDNHSYSKVTLHGHVPALVRIAFSLLLHAYSISMREQLPALSGR